MHIAVFYCRDGNGGIMEFIVEDGTNVEGANAYAALAYADAYFENRGITGWGEMTQEARQQRIIVATQYIDARWFGQFKGDKVYADQTLEFPRSEWVIDITDANTGEIIQRPFMPAPLLMAACEYAWAVDGETMSLAVNYETTDTGDRIKRKKEQVGTLQTDTEYFSPGSAEGSLWANYTLADSLIARLLKQSNVMRCIRN